MVNSKLIGELKVNDQIEGEYILKDASIRAAFNGKAFLSAVLSDRSGVIDAVVWNYNDPIGSDDKGKSVKIKGTVTSYRGKLQIVIDKICLAPASAAPSDAQSTSKITNTSPVQSKTEKPAVPPKAASHGKSIAEMEGNDKVDGFYLLQTAAVRSGSNGKSFLAGTLLDKTGSLPIKVWDYSGPIGSADEGKPVKIVGTVSDYRGELQVVAEGIRLALPSDSFDISDLIPVAPIDADEAYKGIEKIVATIADADYKAICDVMLKRHAEEFMKIPAAKSVHHSFLHGLLMHTGNMLKTADYLAGLYSDVVDRNLLLAGTLLHDFAKSVEFTFSEFGLVTDYSVKGWLLGHLVMGAREIADVAKELHVPEEKSVLLQHLILSHHGKPEFGAAVAPLCAESELLSYIDLIDSRMEIYREKFGEVPVGEFSPSVFVLDNKKIYHHKDLTNHSETGE